MKWIAITLISLFGLEASAFAQGSAHPRSRADSQQVKTKRANLDLGRKFQRAQESRRHRAPSARRADPNRGKHSRRGDAEARQRRVHQARQRQLQRALKHAKAALVQAARDHAKIGADLAATESDLQRAERRAVRLDHQIADLQSAIREREHRLDRRQRPRIRGDLGRVLQGIGVQLGGRDCLSRRERRALRRELRDLRCELEERCDKRRRVGRKIDQLHCEKDRLLADCDAANSRKAQAIAKIRNLQSRLQNCR